MDKLKQVGALVVLGFVITGCDHSKSGAVDSENELSTVTSERNPEVVGRVKREVATILGNRAEKIKESDQFIRDLGADSLDAVEIVMAIEDAFDIAIADADAAQITTVGELVDYVQTKVAAKAP